MIKKDYIFCDNGIVGHCNLGGLGKIASAYGIFTEEGDLRYYHCELEDNCTNNYGEMKAIQKGILAALQVDCKEVVVFSDSELCIKWLNGIYTLSIPKIKSILLENLELIKQFDSCEFKWIPRDKNVYPDFLTTKELQPFRKTKKKLISEEMAIQQTKLFLQEQLK